MKQLSVIGTLLLILSVPSPSSAEIFDKARLSYVQAGVLIRDQESGTDWMSASVNMPLKAGDSLFVTGGSKAEVHFLGGIFLRANEETRVAILALESGVRDHSVEVSVDRGSVYTNYTDTSSQITSMRIYTPAFTAAVSEPSRFRIDAYDDGYTEIKVFEGNVSVDGRFGSSLVHAGSRFSAGDAAVADLSPFSVKPADAWDRWNMTRDSLYSGPSESIRYLPVQLHDFKRDFDENGRWVYASEYGYVWTPTIVVSGWAPYKKGRWMWSRNDYVWVSYDSWGWAPHHYGRWIFRIGIGWCWVPPIAKAVFWSPGFVAWVHAPTYVSWVPLAPGEIYYGYGYFGPNSVNIINVNINRIKRVNVYRNVRARNGVSVVHKDTFLTGKKRRRDKIPHNPFLLKKEQSAIGRPHIQQLKKNRSLLSPKTVKKRYGHDNTIGAKRLDDKYYGSRNKDRTEGPERRYTKNGAGKNYRDPLKHNASERMIDTGVDAVYKGGEKTDHRTGVRITSPRGASLSPDVKDQKSTARSQYNFGKSGQGEQQSTMRSGKRNGQYFREQDSGGRSRGIYSMFPKLR